MAVGLGAVAQQGLGGRRVTMDAHGAVEASTTCLASSIA
jgi:hypothetical protein